MNPLADTNRSPRLLPDADRNAEPPPPANWREALFTLLASRVALIRLEAKEAARDGVRRMVCLVVAAICLVLTWILLLAGGIAAVSSAADWQWHWVALAAAAAHLAAAVWLVLSAKSPGPPAFQVTRSEFQKDREWLHNLSKTPKSNG